MENLLDWIPREKVKKHYYSLKRNKNPLAFSLLLEFMNFEHLKGLDFDDSIPRNTGIEFNENNIKHINISALASNPNAIHLFTPTETQYFSQEIWEGLSQNSHPNAIDLLESNPQNIDWFYLSVNSHPSAIHLLEQNPNKIDWEMLSENPNAIHLLEANLDKIDWEMLSSNPCAIHLLEQNPDKIDWEMLSSNPGAIHLLEQNPDKIDWNEFCRNPNAIHILEQNLDKIIWESLFENPGIFYEEYNDYVLK
jgi:hypothetical protein